MTAAASSRQAHPGPRTDPRTPPLPVIGHHAFFYRHSRALIGSRRLRDRALGVVIMGWRRRGTGDLGTGATLVGRRDCCRRSRRRQWSRGWERGWHHGSGARLPGTAGQRHSRDRVEHTDVVPVVSASLSLGESSEFGAADHASFAGRSFMICTPDHRACPSTGSGNETLSSRSPRPALRVILTSPGISPTTVRDLPTPKGPSSNPRRDHSKRSVTTVGKIRSPLGSRPTPPGMRPLGAGTVGGAWSFRPGLVGHFEPYGAPGRVRRPTYRLRRRV